MDRLRRLPHLWVYSCNGGESRSRPYLVLHTHRDQRAPERDLGALLAGVPQQTPYFPKGGAVGGAKTKMKTLEKKKKKGKTICLNTDESDVGAPAAADPRVGRRCTVEGYVQEKSIQLSCNSPATLTASFSARVCARNDGGRVQELRVPEGSTHAIIIATSLQPCFTCSYSAAD